MSERLTPPDRNRFPALTAGERWLRELPASTLLGRVFRAGGEHPSEWHEFRRYGPLDARYEPHPPPTAEHANAGVMYATLEQASAPASSSISSPASAPNSAHTPSQTPAPASASASPPETDPRDPSASAFAACLLEVFQRGFIDRVTGAPTFVAFETVRPLRLLDLSDSDWLAVAGGNAAMVSGDRAAARQWAREIAAAYPEIDGVLAASSVIPSARVAALWLPAASALPQHPLSLLPLARPEIAGVLEAVADRYGLLLL